MNRVRDFDKSTRLPIALACGVTMGLLSGCQNDVIQSYRVPRSEAAKRELRMLAAILPHGERTWYFKLTGPAQEVGVHKDEFRKFVESSRFSDNSNQPLIWDNIPESWQREPTSGPRYATFQVDPNQPSIELTVTSLGRESGSVLDNVQRWRGQLGLPPIAPDELSKLVETAKVADMTAQFVDMTGTGSLRNTMQTPPFAAGQSPRLFPTGGDEAKPPKYTKPADWTESQSEMSVLTFRVAKGDQSAKVTVTPLPGQAGGLLQNVNRWRSQLGLEPVSDEGIRKEAQKIDIAGVTGDYVSLAGHESAGNARQAILGVLFEQGTKTWFVKMMGNAELVKSEKPNFEAFVRSIQFEKSDGSK
jgi:hypothetical protein